MSRLTLILAGAALVAASAAPSLAATVRPKFLTFTPAKVKLVQAETSSTPPPSAPPAAKPPAKPPVAGSSNFLPIAGGIAAAGAGIGVAAGGGGGTTSP